ncbi:MAG: hypothetical protein O3C60_11015 [Planctomycetota bacterium]|nr:hypothetical protein [Planctomycetota bacterium]
MSKACLKGGATEATRLVACVHDEVIIELPEHGIDHKAAADDVSRIMREAMRDVIQSDLPVNCEYALMRRWYKGAKPTFDDAGRLVPWEPRVPPSTAVSPSIV